MLKVVAPDMASYQDFLSSYLLKIGVVRTVNTSFVLKQQKSTTALPMDQIRDKRGQVVQVVVRLTDHGENLAGAYIEGHKGALAVAERGLALGLKIDIEAGGQGTALDGEIAPYSLNLKAGRIDNPDLASGLSLKVIVKGSDNVARYGFSVVATTTC